MAKERNPPTKQENPDKQKSTWFAMETYLPLELVQKWCDEEFDNKIRHYAYCYHDKDDNETHTHLVINTVKQHEVQTVRNWFYKFGNENGSDQNTLGQVLINAEAMERYLTHTDQKSIKLGKHQYSKEDVVTDSPDWYRDSTAPRGHEKKDNTMDIIDSIIRGDSYRSMIQRFGRDLVINYRHYQTMATLILSEESEADNELDNEMRTIGETDSKSVAILDELISTIV